MIRHIRITVITVIAVLTGTTTLAQTHARVENEMMNVKVESLTRYSINYNMSITALDEKGADFIEIIIPLNKGEKLTDFSGTLRDADGKVLRMIKKSELTRTEYSSALAADGATMIWKYTPTRFPVTLSYNASTVASLGYAALPLFYPQNATGLEIKHSAYKLVMPADGSKCRIKTWNIPADSIKSELNEKGCWTYTTQLDNVSALNSEELAPRLKERCKYVYFIPEKFSFDSHVGSLTSWDEYGHWISDLLIGRSTLPPELCEKLHQITSTCKNEHEKLAAIYKYLGETTRYVSIQLGIGGFQPMLASEVYRTGFGDCKALTNYMIAMLAEVGIKAYYCIIGTNTIDVDHNQPAFDYFNHVVAKAIVDGDTVWVENTAPELPLGFVHSKIEGHETFVMDGPTGHIERVASYADSLNVCHNICHGVITSDGKAQLQVKVKMENNFYEKAMDVAKLSQQEQQNVVNSLMSIPTSQIEKHNITEYKQPYAAPNVTIEAELSCPNYCQKTNERIFIPLSPFDEAATPPAEVANRSTPLCVYEGKRICDSIVYELPEGYKIEACPGNKQIKSKYGDFNISTSKTDKTITIKTSNLTYAGRFDASEQKAFREHIISISSMLKQKIVLKKTE